MRFDERGDVELLQERLPDLRCRVRPIVIVLHIRRDGLDRHAHEAFAHIERLVGHDDV